MRVYGFTEYGGPAVGRLLDVPEPEPAAGQVLIRTEAAGVNPADIKVRSGQRQDTVPVRFPMAMGREAAGTVVSVGEGVQEVGPGDAVFGACAAGTGALAELVLLDAAGTAPRPRDVSAEQAATIPVALGTAFDIAHQLGLGPGQTVVVLGAGGGVGTAVCQLGAHLGATVVGVASAGKASVVAGTGARAVASGPGWEQRVRSELRGVPADSAVDLVGGGSLDVLAALVPDPRRLVSPADPSRAARLGGGGATRRRTARVFGQVADLMASGVLRPHLTTFTGLTNAGAAVEMVESGHALGKVVVQLR